MASGKTNAGLSYGLLSGGAAILLTLVLYLGGAKMFVNPIAYLGFAIPIVFAVLGGLVQKKANGGYLEFSEALKTVFTIFVIGSFLSTAFMFLLLNVIDVPFRQALSQETAQASEKMMEKFGVPQDQIDKSTAEILNGNSYSLGKQFLGFAFGTIFWFIISLIIAAIIKKKKPEFDNNSFSQ